MKVINLEYGHRCRSEPVEAAIYSLEAKGEELEKFRANASTELTVELEETTKEQSQKKQERFFLELPLDFTKEYLAKVKTSYISHKLKDAFCNNHKQSGFFLKPFQVISVITP